jgi:ATP-dependent exoDNAse (exonuclease V) alpha subunit
VVIVPLHEKMYHKLLNRTMLYTALTRAKQLVVVVATQVRCRRVLTGGTAAAYPWC